MNLPAAWLAAAFALATPAAAAPAQLTGPGLGPDAPPAGRSLLDEVFPAGLPTPFAAVLDRLRALAGRENVATALIPLGRSLQRYGADPDFFASPRVVVAVTGDLAAGPDGLRLGDRLYLGYQPAADVIEAISYNPAAGRFEFQEIVRYTADAPAAAEPAERRVCLACHQGQGPIFPRPLWSETNADPAIAARLAPLGPTFHGAPVRQTVDALERFDAATDRAARLPLADRLWAEACPDAPCRAALLAAALRFGLAGAAPTDTPASFAATLWPDGLAAISPDLPNRDPLQDEANALETAGRLDPETPRPALMLWQPDASAFAAAAREIAAQFSPGDLAWIDARLRRAAGRAETITLPCTTTAAALPTGAREARFSCAAAGARAEGFRAPGRTGRIALLSLPGAPPTRNIDLPPDGAPPRARLADGRRIERLTLTATAVELSLADDLARLDAGLAAQAGAAALAAGPFPRSAALALIGSILGGTDG